MPEALYREPEQLAHRNEVIHVNGAAKCARCYLETDGKATGPCKDACLTCGNRLVKCHEKQSEPKAEA